MIGGFDFSSGSLARVMVPMSLKWRKSITLTSKRLFLVSNLLSLITFDCTKESSTGDVQHFPHLAIVKDVQLSHSPHQLAHLHVLFWFEIQILVILLLPFAFMINETETKKEIRRLYTDIAISFSLMSI